MIALLIALQISSTHCSPDYLGGMRCTTNTPPPLVVQPLPHSGYVDQDWAGAFKALRDRKRAEAVGKLLAAGDCAGAEQYALRRGGFALVQTVRDYCASAQMSAPVPQAAQSGPRKIRARTPSGYCLDAPEGYVGTGAENSPAVTSALPRCDGLSAN
jgi:hypothetical protein